MDIAAHTRRISFRLQQWRLRAFNCTPGNCHHELQVNIFYVPRSGKLH